MQTLIWKGQKNIIFAKKGRKWAKRFFEKKLGRGRKSIQFGKLDQKSLFFIWFFIVDGQKTI